MVEADPDASRSAVFVSDAPPPPPEGYQQYGYGYGLGGPQSQYAGFWARFASVVIDGFIIGVPSQIIGAASTTLGLIVQFVGGIVYVGLLEGGPTGQTLGRRVLNLRVVDSTTGQPGIGFGRAVGRYFAKFLSAIAFALGYLWMLWDPKKQTWHDKLVSTLVVKA